ncbi:MAG: diguanylate cyclase [Pseudoxanthomonas sp.]
MDNDRSLVRRVSFGKRMYPMRSTGMLVGLWCVGSVLYQHDVGWPWWVLLGLHAFVWPHVAYLLMLRASNPVRAEYRNLTVDSMLGGMWIAAMAFDTLPSVVLAVMLVLDKVIVGGGRFSAKTFASMALTCLTVSALIGFPFQPYTSYLSVIGSLPLLIVYPLVIAVQSRRLAQRTLIQKRVLEKTSRFDAATGLMNREQWQFVANVELNRFVRTAQPAVLMMIDIDDFKTINDGYGHTVGDTVIEEFALLMKACLRDQDTGGRYGGDEFGIVMPNTRWEEAIVAAERLRRQVAAYNFPGYGEHCTISIGLAEINPTIHNVTEWVISADEALYSAKHKGRDRIEVAKLPGVTPVTVDAIAPRSRAVRGV